MTVRQLETSAFASLLPVYESAPRQFALIRAVLEERQPGTAHAIEIDDQRCFFVTNRFGFAHFFGGGENAAAQDQLFTAISGDPALRNRYLLWYDPPRRCRERMEQLPEKVARARTRVLFRFDATQFDKLNPAIQTTAKGTEIMPLDARAIGEIDDFGLDIGKRFWPSEEAFLRHGIGAVARIDNRVVSLCYAASVAGNVAEVDVATLDGFQGKGLARVVTSAFITGCREKGITPNWDCFDYNKPSSRLAESLGFEELTRYPFYSINT